MATKTPIKAPFALTTSSGRSKYPEFSSHTCASMATIMAEFHNVLFRGFNSAYLYSYSISPDSPSATDLLDYSSLICAILEMHHDWEETSLFPALEKYAGQPGLLDTNTAQHKAFEDGLHSFHAYCDNPETKKNFDSATYRTMVDSFAPALEKHMHAEPETFYRLRNTNSAGLSKIQDEQNAIARAKGELWK
jgi:hypothetical protein